MKKVIFPLILLVVAVFLAVMITQWSVSSTAKSEGQFKVGLMELHTKFMKNNSLLRPIVDSQGRADLQKYLNEVNTLMAWYFREPVAEFWKAYPDSKNPESIIREKRKIAEDEGPNKRKAKGNLPIEEECYQLVKGVYDEIKGGKYSALGSDFQGSVRLDLHAAKSEAGQIRWEIMTWGGIGQIVFHGLQMRFFKTPTAQEQRDYQNALADYKKEKALSESKKAKAKGAVLTVEEPKDPATLHYAEAQSTSGRPVLPDFEGTKYIHDFPAGVSVNYFSTPMLPADAEKIEIIFKMKVKLVSGEEQAMSYAYKIPVDSNWKGSWDNVRKVEAGANY
jgi:hypothetical protein